MIFDYVSYLVEPSAAAPDRKKLYRPVIPVRVSGPHDSFLVWSLLDTGADESYITESVAAELGLVRHSNERSKIQSASGEISAWYSELSLEISDENESHRVLFKVGVVDEDWTEMILGHLGFFEHFDALFSDTDRTVTLTRRGKYTQ